VNEDNDRRLLATYPSTTTQPNRKRPAVDPKVDKGASNLNEVINLLDHDNKKEEEETETLINIDDDTEFPSISALPPSPSKTERPQKTTDTKRTPSKLDSRRSSTSTQSSIRLPSMVVKLSQKDEAYSTGSMEQSKLSFNRNGNISSLKINSRASSLLQLNSNKDRNGNRTNRPSVERQ
jgi:hypothetical protein